MCFDGIGRRQHDPASGPEAGGAGAPHGRRAATLPLSSRKKSSRFDRRLFLIRSAREEARICVLQALTCLKEALGDLSRLRRMLGVELDDRGFVRVNERLETSASDVWVLGECAGGPMFTHISEDDFRIVSRNLADLLHVHLSAVGARRLERTRSGHTLHSGVRHCP